ncbi:MAG: KpsF/GutQ family sugar-phosphate isomerase [Oligoflexia bacterium]|nr:KpsF/GutQ family sugar-phosphate isomerase [Oligoflexia bacterium]
MKDIMQNYPHQSQSKSPSKSQSPSKVLNHSNKYLQTVHQALLSEANAILDAIPKINPNNLSKIINIFELLLNTGGNLIFSGVGKSGLIGHKLASTFSSLGLPSFFLHPTEALHGDLGRVSKNDALVIISKSGSSEEIIKLLPFIPIAKNMTIALLGNINSTISQYSDIVFDCSVKREACINNQAPTTSSTLSLAIGDSLAVLFESMVGLSKEKFAVNHPGGLLGKGLRLLVNDLMINKQNAPILTENTTLRDAIIKMTEIPLGICAIVDPITSKLSGIIVEGDIRRLLGGPSLDNNAQILNTSISSIMNKKPVSIAPNELAYLALELMENRERQISVLPVVGSDNEFLGVIRLHDLLKEGFFLRK